MFAPLRGSPRRLRLLVIAVYAAGMACMLVAALFATTAAQPGGGRLVLAAGIVAAGELAVMHLRFGGERYTFTWSEAAVVLGIVLVPFPFLVLLAPLAVALTHGLSGRMPVKVLYNATSAAIAVFVARLASTATYGHLNFGADRGWRFWVGLVVAAVAFSAVNSVLTAAAVAFSQNMSLRAVGGRGLNATLGVLAGNTLVALLLVQISWNAATVLMLPALLGLLYTAYRGYLSAREDRDTWRELEAASKDLVTLDVSRLARVAAERALRLARADEVELFVRGPEGRIDRYHGDQPDLVTCDEDVPPVLDLIDMHGGLVRSSHESTDGTPATHALTMPLEDPESGMALGALRLWFRSDVRLSDRERQVLVTFGRSAAASLCNARMYERAEHAARVHEHEATHDSLTGLPNRALLRRRVAEVLEEPNANVSLLLVDLDHFKSINDTLGHPTGDRLLQAAARRLSTVIRSSDTIARLGGDEFAILLPGLTSPDDADVVAKALIDALATPVIVDGLRLSVEGSIGISHHPYDAGSVDDLLAHADIALYQAKTARGSFRHYSKERDDSSVSRLTLAAELRGALARDELVLHFQPQFNVADGELIGAEALVRWAHPQRGLLPPSEFISLAEDSGLAHEFTLHVLSKAIQEAATWRDLGSDAHVAVNLSARNLLDPELATAVEAALLRHRLPASRLVLEITERTVMSELDVVERVLGELRALGVQLSVDDFGTGYSSMAFLTRSAVNELKVDRGFVSNMVTSDSDRAIVRATIELAHGLGLRVIAEGVEDEETWQALRNLGCDSAQGFYLARPLAVEQLRARMLTAAATPTIAQQRRTGDAAVVALHRR